jgi:hypothetical protein
MDEFLPWPARMVQGLSSSSQVAVTCIARRHKRVLPGYAAVPSVSDHCRKSDFPFLRGIRALRLGWGYGLVLTVPITIALWLAIHLIVDLGRI